VHWFGELSEDRNTLVLAGWLAGWLERGRERGRRKRGEGDGKERESEGGREKGTGAMA